MSRFEPSQPGFRAFQARWDPAGAQSRESKLQKGILQACESLVKNLRLWPENNGKPLKGFRGGGGEGGVSWPKLKFQKIPLAARGGGWDQSGAWGLVGGWSLPAQITDNGGSASATSSAEWTSAAGVGDGSGSEGRFQGALGWEVGKGEVKGDIQVWGFRAAGERPGRELGGPRAPGS